MGRTPQAEEDGERTPLSRAEDGEEAKLEEERAKMGMGGNFHLKSVNTDCFLPQHLLKND